MSNRSNFSMVAMREIPMPTGSSVFAGSTWEYICESQSFRALPKPDYSLVIGGLESIWDDSAKCMTVQPCVGSTASSAHALLRIDSQGVYKNNNNSTPSMNIFNIPNVSLPPLSGVYDTAAVPLTATVTSSDPSSPRGDTTSPKESVLIIGGRNAAGTATNSCYWIHPNRGYRPLTSGPLYTDRISSSAPPLNRPRTNALAASFIRTSGSDRHQGFIVAGGTLSAGSGSIEVYLSESSFYSWTEYQHLLSTHVSGAIAVYPDQSRVLLIGGVDATSVNETLPLQPIGGLQFFPSQLVSGGPSARSRFASGFDNSGRFWVCGGIISSTSLRTDETWYFDFTSSSGSWNAGPVLPSAIADAKFVSSKELGSDEILVIGGNTSTTDAINGFVCRFRSLIPAWTAITPLLTPRLAGHEVVSLPATSVSRSISSTSSMPSSIVVFGGEMNSLNGVGRIPDINASSEILRASGTRNFASTILLPYANITKNSPVMGVDTLEISADVSGARLFPLLSATLSGWSGSDGYQMLDVLNSDVSGVYSPVSGSKLGLQFFRDSSTSLFSSSIDRLYIYVPHGSVRNNKPVTLLIGTGSAATISSANISGTPAEVRALTPSTSSALGPGTAFTASGYWMDTALSMTFGSSDNSVYNGARFTASFLSSTEYYHFFRLPNATDFTLDVSSGHPVYLRQGILHDVRLLQQVHDTNQTLAYVSGITPVKWLSTVSGNIGNPTSNKLLWYKLDEPNSSSSVVVESVKNQSLNNTGWNSGTEQSLFPQFRSDRISGSRLLRAGSTASSLPAISSQLFSVDPNIPLRDALNRGAYSVEFWYYSPSGSPSPGYSSTGAPFYTPAEIFITASTLGSTAGSWDRLNITALYNSENILTSWMYGDSNTNVGCSATFNFSSSLSQFANYPQARVSFRVTAAAVARENETFGASNQEDVTISVNYDGLAFASQKIDPLFKNTYQNFNFNVGSVDVSYAISTPMTVNVVAHRQGSDSEHNWAKIRDLYVVANVTWPVTRGAFGGMSSSVVTASSPGWSINSFDDRVNIYNGYLITIGGQTGSSAQNSNICRGGGIGPVFSTNSLTFNSSISCTGTHAYHKTSNTSLDWGNNVILQIGFDADNIPFVGWDVGPWYYSSGSLAEVARFHNQLPVNDGIWHYVCINVNADTTQSFAITDSSDFPLYRRGNVDIYVDSTGVFDSAMPSGSFGLRNTKPDGGTFGVCALSSGLTGAAPDFGAHPGYAVRPGDRGAISLGPLRNTIVDDLVIASGTRTGVQMKRTMERGRGLIY